MLQARIEIPGDLPVIVIGLSNGNIRNLKAGRPILLGLQEHYALDASLLIMWGETEAAIEKELREQGPRLRVVTTVPVAASAQVPRAADPSLGLGATGKNVGTLGREDEGELRAGISIAAGHVLVDFGKNVSWLTLTAEQAQRIGTTLLDRAKELAAQEMS